MPPVCDPLRFATQLAQALDVVGSKSAQSTLPLAPMLTPGPCTYTCTMLITHTRILTLTIAAQDACHSVSGAQSPSVSASLPPQPSSPPGACTHTHTFYPVQLLYTYSLCYLHVVTHFSTHSMCTSDSLSNLIFAMFPLLPLLFLHHGSPLLTLSGIINWG